MMHALTGEDQYLAALAPHQDRLRDRGDRRRPQPVPARRDRRTTARPRGLPGAERDSAVVGERLHDRAAGEAIGPSVAAFGVGCGSTGTRADLLICDDVVDVRSLHSKVDRDRVADYFTNNLMNLLEPDGRCWVLFTPWHLDDLNARLKRNEMYALFHRAIGPDLEPVWPEKWPTENLHTRKDEVGTSSFARGYRLVPLADEETPIRPEWVQYWTEPAECEQVILSVDPAVRQRRRPTAARWWCLGRRGKCSHEVRVLAAPRAASPAPELVALIDEFDRQWNPSVILFESNAAFRGSRICFTLQTRFGAKLKGVTQTADKAARVAAFSVAVENGAFRLKGDGRIQIAQQRELFDEMTTFPFGEHDDLLDAAATGCACLSGSTRAARVVKARAFAYNRCQSRCGGTDERPRGH